MTRLVLQSLDYILTIMQYAIFISVIFSWIPLSRDSVSMQRVAGVLSLLTEPILAPIRRILDTLTKGRLGMIDFSPLVAILLIGFLQKLIKSVVFIP